MRRGTTLAPEPIAFRLEAAAKRAARMRMSSWDGEPTELDLRFEFARVEGAARVSVATIEQNDDDLPMLDGSEFVAALDIDDLEPGRRSRPRRARPPQKTAAASLPWQTAWLAFLALCIAIILSAWMVRQLELVRLLGLI